MSEEIISALRVTAVKKMDISPKACGRIEPVTCNAEQLLFELVLVLEE